MQGIPVVGDLMRRVYRKIRTGRQSGPVIPNSKDYWEKRYASGIDSGVGSYGIFAEFKAKILNAFVAKNNVKSVIEFGCGDGSQLELAAYPIYLGLDVSSTVIEICRKKFTSDNTKSFQQIHEYAGATAELALSLDVIYHVLEDKVFDEYMRSLFAAASRFVIVYSSDTNDNVGFEDTHVRHRQFSDWISTNTSGWKLKTQIPNQYPYKGDYKTGTFADFYVYEQS